MVDAIAKNEVKLTNLFNGVSKSGFLKSKLNEHPKINKNNFI